MTLGGESTGGDLVVARRVYWWRGDHKPITSTKQRELCQKMLISARQKGKTSNQMVAIIAGTSTSNTHPEILCPVTKPLGNIVNDPSLKNFAFISILLL